MKCLSKSVPGILCLTQKRYLSGDFVRGVALGGFIQGACPWSLCSNIHNLIQSLKITFFYCSEFANLFRVRQMVHNDVSEICQDIHDR